MDGIIVINKPKKFASHDVVAKVKKILNVKKVGHTGTLDPNATGVLPLLLNDGTKLSKYLIEHDKEYEVKLKFGIKTDTLDGEGKILEEKGFCLENFTEEQIKKNLKKSVGKQSQIPPMYSAIKINGKKLYEYAREGKQIEVKPRQIEIYSIDLLGINYEENEIDFKVSCSKGTYIRSLCEDIANTFGTVGYMKELNRTQVGRFNISNSITIEELEKNKNDINFLNEHIITMKDLFKEYNNIALDEKNLKKLLNGMLINVTNNDGIHNIYCNDNYIGIGIVNNRKLKRKIITNL